MVHRAPWNLSLLQAIQVHHANESVHLARPPFGSLFPSPRGSRGRPPHTLSGDHPWPPGAFGQLDDGPPSRRAALLVFRSKLFVPTIDFAEQHKIKDLRVFRADPKERNVGVETLEWIRIDTDHIRRA